MTGAPITRLAAALADRYRIERELGAGGMATVYLAEDVRHKRRVALKVLKPELAAVIGGDRFIQEITTTAALQHPHILPLFDSGDADGFLFYVMPFIDGETLRSKLDRETQLGVDEAVRIACDVGDALQYAHSCGVVHRDIKPENILLANGRPIVADFGIALALSAAAGGRMTETGLSLGTPYYMSPEQATAEKEISARSDIYSLGSVLYEMLAGQPPHMGGSAQQIIMKIITETARPVTELRKSVPPHVAAAVQQSLEKLPADRFDSAAAFVAALGNHAFRRATDSPAAPLGSMRARDRVRDPVQSAVAVVALLAIGAAGWLAATTNRASTSTPVRFAITSANARPVLTHTWPAAVSPDGRTIVYAGEAPSGNYQFYARGVDDLEARAVPGTLNGNQPMFSPDGRWVAVEAGGQLIKVELDGGAVVPIVAANGINGSAWSRNGTIVLGSEGSISGLATISDAGGALVPLTHTNPATPETYHVWPIILDDGKSVVFAEWNGHGLASRSSTLSMTALDDGTVHPLGVEGVRPIGVVDRHLLYLTSEGVLMAIAFDARRMKVTGSAVPLLDSIPLCRYCNGDSPVYLSTSGALAYMRGDMPSRLMWMDARGASTIASPREATFANPRVSPDGKRVAVTIIDKFTDIWILELATGNWTRLTSGGNNSHPEWSPDGANILFVSDRGGKMRGWRQAADSRGVPETLTPAIDGLKYVIQSAASSVFVLNLFEQNKSVIWSMPMRADATPSPLLSEAAWIGLGRLSPDGRFLAYVSDEAGLNDVYVQPFPGNGGRVQISSKGGTDPQWSKDGSTLYYIAGSRVMAAALAYSPGVRVVRQDSLFTGEASDDFASATYDVHDGKFLMLRTDERRVQLIIALNWASGVLAKLNRH